MAQFTGVGSHNSNYTGTLTVTEKSYSIENNTSEIEWTLSVTSSNGWYFADWNVTSTVEINGATCLSETARKTLTKNGVTIIASGTADVEHNTDGSKTVSCSASMQTATSQSYLFGTITMSGNLTLTTIPRVSNLAAPSIDINTAGSLTITRAVASFRDTITWSCATLSGTVVTKTNNSALTQNVSFTPPSSLFAKLPTSTSATITYIITTYLSDGSTVVGTKTVTSTVKVGSNIKPTLSISCAPVNTQTGLSGKSIYVAGFSKVTVATTATAGTGSSIVNYSISIDGQSGTGASWTSDVLMTSGSKTVTVTVTDGRGRTETDTAQIYVAQYSAPAITAISTARGTYENDTWTPAVNGDHIKVLVKSSISLTDQPVANTQTIYCKCDGTVLNANASPATFYFTTTLATSSYRIEAWSVDALNVTGSTAIKIVPSMVVPFYWQSDRLGFGKVGESAELVDSAWNMRVRKTNETLAMVRTENPNGMASLRVGATGARGLFDDTADTWIIYVDTDGLTRLYNPVRTVVGSTTSTLTLSEQSGRIHRINYNGAVTVTVPAGLPVGYEAYIVPYYLNERITINASGSEHFVQAGATATATSITTTQSWTTIHLIKAHTSRWYVTIG